MIAPISALSAATGVSVGGKAWNCSRLLRAGFPVPDAIVITPDTESAEIDRIPAHPWFATVSPDATFAVRSSGLDEDSRGHSFAGIHETELDVPRAEIVDAVRRCRASGDSRQASAYRQVRQVEARGIAVLVQVLVRARVSGVAFTVNPATGEDQIVVNSTLGLGESLVSGRIEPDEYIVSKRDGSIVSSRAGTKGMDRGSVVQSLTPPELAELATIVRRIEQFYGAPQDIEWCHDGTRFWIVQSRPVTSHEPPATSHRPDPEWTRANVAEVLPEQVSPQALDLYETGLDRAERQFMGKLFAPEEALGPVTKAFHGRLYFNLSQLRRIAAIVGAPAGNLLRSFGHSEQIAPADERRARMPIAERLRALPSLIRAAIKGATVKRMLRKHDAMVRLAGARFSRCDPRTLDDRALWSEIDHWAGAMPDHIQVVFAVAGTLLQETVLRRICQWVAISYQDLVLPILAAGEPSVSTQQAIDLVRVSEVARRHGMESDEFRAAFDRFLAEYGHRGRYESDWALPRSAEDPAPLLFAIRQHLDRPAEDPDVMRRRVDAAADAAWRRFESRLTWLQRIFILPRVRLLLADLKWRYVTREKVRSDLARVLAHVRQWHLELANRFVERGWLRTRDDYFLLRFAEIGRAIDNPTAGSELIQIAAARAAQREADRHLRLPLLMRESELPARIRAPSSPDVASVRLQGLCVSPGSATAELVVMRDPGEFGRMKPGAILVAPATDPSWTPLFTLASGVIVEVGGLLSHASTIAREYGLPALANVKDATSILQTGEVVRLDATGGFVERTLLQSPAYGEEKGVRLSPGTAGSLS